MVGKFRKAGICKNTTRKSVDQFQMCKNGCINYRTLRNSSFLLISIVFLFSLFLSLFCFTTISGFKEEENKEKVEELEAEEYEERNRFPSLLSSCDNSINKKKLNRYLIK
jgi:hypothetical protein